ncbi:MAG: TetR/AcrR family transcriptional regulator [Cypionkella sp.]
MPQDSQIKRQTVRMSTEDRRAQIAQAALRCLEKVGRNKLTARKVAAEAGLSLGHLTYHYADMNQVLRAGFALAAEKVQEAGRLALIQPGGTSAERLDRFLRAGFGGAEISAVELRLRVDLWASALTDPDIADIEWSLYQNQREAVERLLQRMAAAYAVERVPQVADMIMATLDGLWLDWLRRQDESAVNNGLEGCVLFARLRLGGS